MLDRLIDLSHHDEEAKLMMHKLIFANLSHTGMSVTRNARRVLFGTCS